MVTILRNAFLSYTRRNFWIRNAKINKLKKFLSLFKWGKNLGLNIPRIDVRIGEDKSCNVLGKGRLNDNIIWITPRAINKGENYLRHTVLHELIHTIYGCGHNSKCHLMKDNVTRKMTKWVIWKC